MHNAAEEAELIKVIRRYVTPDRRYLKLGGALLGTGVMRARIMDGRAG